MKFFVTSLLCINILQNLHSQNIVLVPKAVELKKTTVKLNGTINAAMGGTGRSVIEILLPNNTKEWYYNFTTRHDANAERTNAAAIELTSKIAGLLATSYTGGLSTQFSGLAAAEVKSIVIPAGTIPVNAYAIDQNNINQFKNGKSFYPILGTANESQVSGSALINSFTEGIVFIGLVNPNARSGVLIDVEVTAVVLDKKTVNEENNTANVETAVNIYKNSKEEKKTDNIEEKTFYIKNITDTIMEFQYSINNKNWSDATIYPGELKKLKYEVGNLFIKYLTPKDEIEKSALDADHVYYFKHFMSLITFSYYKD